jgi:hypothetical protein
VVSEIPAIKLSAGMEMVCRLALYSSEVRDWLSMQSDLRPRDIEPGGALLESILNHVGLEEGGSALTVFAASLPPEMERALARLEPPRPDDNHLEICRENWKGLADGRLRQNLEVLKARLRQPGTSREEQTRLQKEILDTSCRLKDITRPAA